MAPRRATPAAAAATDPHKRQNSARRAPIVTIPLAADGPASVKVERGVSASTSETRRRGFQHPLRDFLSKSFDCGDVAAPSDTATHQNAITDRTTTQRQIVHHPLKEFVRRSQTREDVTTIFVDNDEMTSLLGANGAPKMLLPKTRVAKVKLGECFEIFLNLIADFSWV